MTLPQQTYKMKTEIQEQCTICYEIIDSTNPTVITEEILKHLQLLNTNINVALLQQAVICESCLVKIKSACKFKTSYLDLQQIYLNIKTEDEGYAQKQIVCEICKITVNARDTVPLFDPVAKTNKLMLINYLSPELESKSRNYPQTCESCHKSVLIFCNITNLLSTLDQETCELYLKGCVITKQEPPPDSHSISANSSEHCSMDIKEELQDLINEQSNVEYNKFFIKNEELDLKMDSEEEPGDVGQWVDDGQEIDKCEGTTRTNKAVHVQLFRYEPKMKNKRSRTKHMNLEESKVLNCEMCKYTTILKKNLNRHMLSHKKPEEVDMCRCEMCEYTTRHKSNLKKHMLSHKNPDEVEMFQCQQCEFKTKKKSILKRHFMRFHMRPDEVVMFQCTMCEYKAKEKSYLKKHMLIHMKPDEVEVFECKMCEYKAKEKSYLKKHMLIHKKPDEVKMFQCQQCEFKTKRKISLSTHVMIHKKPDEIVMFHCEICEFKTRWKMYLKKHMSIHKKPDDMDMFQCAICEFKTIHKSALKRHILKHDITKQ